jgi:DNA-binding NtrC family response regulator
MRIAFIDDCKNFLGLYKGFVLKYNQTHHEADAVTASYFEDPKEFIKYIEEHGQESFDYAVIDLHMPKMSGYDVAEYLIKKCPHMKEIICSGEIDSKTETLKSIMPKNGFNIDSLLKRFASLRPLRNQLEVKIRASEFNYKLQNV